MTTLQHVADYKPKRCLRHPLPKSDRSGSEAAMQLVRLMSIKQRRDRNWDRDEDLGDMQISAGCVFRRRGDLVYTVHKRDALDADDDLWRFDRMTWSLENMAIYRGLRDRDGFDWRAGWSHCARLARAGFALATRHASDKQETPR